ncbi:MAG: hypothetical protein MJE68_22675 [Proteobacteria bacterium]|nr:hypothetical protein [Pseudomonadota bacterium]
MTARTDPGWVPLYPLCSGLVIEIPLSLSLSFSLFRPLSHLVIERGR